MTNLITEARELCENATPGPWKWVCDDPEFLTLGKSGAEQEYHVLSAWKCKSCQTSGLNCLWPEKYDAAFIARSRTLIPELCDALEKAEEHNKQLMHEVCKLACESVEREKALAKLEAEVIEACNSVRWVPVTEQLPTERGYYLAVVKRIAPDELGGNNTRVKIMRWMGEDWRYAFHFPKWINDEITETVTHWMPLHTPPEEVGL